MADGVALILLPFTLALPTLHALYSFWTRFSGGMGQMATGSRSLYDILGIPQSATDDAVRKAYKLQALQTHPDKLPLGTSEAEIEAAQARFRDVRTAFEVLSDPAKRRAYDNGLEYFRRHVNVNMSGMQAKLAQAKLARERAEWARRAELRHQERMRVLREEVLASQRRYQDTMAKAELRYQERVRAMEEELTAKREEERKEEAAAAAASTASGFGEGAYNLGADMLQELRKMNPEWEVRRREALRRQEERMKKTERPPMRASQGEPVYL